MLTPEERSTRARLAAFSQWSNTIDRNARLANAHAGLRARFEREKREQFPDASDASIAKMVDAALKAHFTRLGFLSGRARRAKKLTGWDVVTDGGDAS